jgi:P-type Cu+ transporter
VTTATEPQEVRLELAGMTCASCVSRIERKLNKLDGVDASVNFATEQATVRHDESVSVEDLVRVVEAAGYGARPVAARALREKQDPLSLRLVVAAVLTAPLVPLAMVPQVQFAGWEWVALAFATPVVFWSGLGFHRAALAGARHATATMDTLISIGTLAAWGWSAGALVAGAEEDVYFEVAAVITTLILLGRWLEGRAKRRSATRSGGFSSSARRRLACSATGSRSPFRSKRSTWVTCSSSGRGRRWPRTARSWRDSRRSTSHC